MRDQVVHMFEAGACPSKVQNTLRVKFAQDLEKLLEIPGLPVFRNFLRSLRRNNVVIRRSVSSVQIEDGVEALPGLTAGMSVGDLRHFVDMHDFDRYLNSRNPTCPPLGLLSGGSQG